MKQETKVIKITNGCVNKPGCNSQVVYILPYLQAKDTIVGKKKAA